VQIFRLLLVTFGTVLRIHGARQVELDFSNAFCIIFTSPNSPPFHPPLPLPAPSMAGFLSYINPRRCRRTLLSVLLIVVAASVFALASLGSFGEIKSVRGLRLSMMEGNGNGATKGEEEHPIFELMREGERR
jgi:hypothetical protein